MKLCDTCIYGDKYELEKPCVIYSDDCKLYEEKKMDDMTRKRAISELEQIYGILSPDKQRALDMAINSLKIDEQYDLMYEQAEPKTGHCKDCKYFEYDSVAKVDGIPLIVAHEICTKWGDGCKSKEDGYCFLFEPKAESEEV